MTLVLAIGATLNLAVVMGMAPPKGVAMPFLSYGGSSLLASMMAGSTFKVITALEYMREHPGAYDGFHFSCDGIYEYENIRIQCYHKTAHGEEDFAASFANSCNGAFASLGLELDLDGLKGLSLSLIHILLETQVQGRRHIVSGALLSRQLIYDLFHKVHMGA